ncbi:MAG: P83/100 family protein [Spirochaetia bacterium]|jgi:hypothetical protein
MELDTTAGRSFRFQSYAGPEPVVESIHQIAGIGEVLSRNLLAGGSRGDYFGKYTVIRAFQPSDTARLSADVIVLGARAQIDDIRNVQRIVAGYLAAAFGYDANQANRLAVLVTKYNAAYRGDIPALSRKYTPLVMSYLSAENAGIALNHAEWPGKTRLVVPLGVAAGAPAGAGGPTPPAGAAGPAAGAAGSAAASPPAVGGRPASPNVAPASVGGSVQGGGTALPAGSAQGGAVAPAGGSAPGGGTAPAGPSGSGQQVITPGGTAPSSSTGGQPATPARATTAAAGGAPRSKPGLFGTSLVWWLLALAALLLLALLVLLFARLTDRLLSPSFERELRRSVREGHPLVEMVVIPQNRRIGHRNIHYLKPGSSGSVGSGRSMFLVYFVPVPRRMGILRYDGRSYSFVPLKSDLFPGVSAPVSDCLGRSIPARSLRGYRFIAPRKAWERGMVNS